MNRIKELRLEKGISQSKLAEILNVTQQAISTYENATRDLDSNTLQILSDYFECTTDYLLGRSDIRNPKIYNKINIELTKKDKKEIEDVLMDTEKALLDPQGLMFDGEPASEEAVQSIIDAMRIGMEIAKKRNKEKYTPKKYKKKPE